jgi:hypothetical protein
VPSPLHTKFTVPFQCEKSSRVLGVLDILSGTLIPSSLRGVARGGGHRGHLPPPLFSQSYDVIMLFIISYHINTSIELFSSLQSRQ